MAGKFVAFQMLVKDDERGENFIHPASAEDVATQLRKMGWTVRPPGCIESCIAGAKQAAEIVSLARSTRPGPWKVEKLPYLLKALEEPDPVKGVLSPNKKRQPSPPCKRKLPC